MKLDGNISRALGEYLLICCQLSFLEELVGFDLLLISPSAVAVQEKLEATVLEWPSCLTDTSQPDQEVLALKVLLIPDYSLQVSSKHNNHLSYVWRDHIQIYSGHIEYDD